MTLYTDIEPYGNFYVAEDYHQKYNLRQVSLLANELYAIYPNPADFRDSTAAARLNGYSVGYGNMNVLLKTIGSLGLSEAGKNDLLQIVGDSLTPGCPVAVCPSNE